MLLFTELIGRWRERTDECPDTKRRSADLTLPLAHLFCGRNQSAAGRPPGAVTTETGDVTWLMGWRRAAWSALTIRNTD